jgi:hypothetical protein
LISVIRDDLEKAIGNLRVRCASIEREVDEVDAGDLGRRRFRVYIRALLRCQPQIDDGCEPHLLDPGYRCWRYGAGACDGGFHLSKVRDPRDRGFLDLGLRDRNGDSDYKDGTY